MSMLMRFLKPHFVACFLLALPLWAQQDSGGLVVSVRDPNGASVTVAKVAVTNVDTNQKFAGATNDTGDSNSEKGLKTSIVSPGARICLPITAMLGANASVLTDLRSTNWLESYMLTSICEIRRVNLLAFRTTMSKFRN